MKTYRPGAIGALADEYEKAIDELKTVLNSISEPDFISIKNNSQDVDFQSSRNVVLHIVRSGYAYANYIRKRFDKPTFANTIAIQNTQEATNELNNMFAYTIETFRDMWHLTDDDLMQTLIRTSWANYDLEALIEHAIVHILRHRLQIQKMIL